MIPNHVLSDHGMVFYEMNARHFCAI